MRIYLLGFVGVMSSRQSRASKRSLAVSTASTSSTARSSSPGAGARAGGGNNDRGPLSSVLSDDDGTGRGRQRGPLGADDSSIVSLSFLSTSGTASNSKGNAAAAAAAAMADLHVSLSTLGGAPSALGGGGGGASPASGRAEAAELLQQLDPSDPRLHLASLNDERSAFGAVSRSCLVLNQWATGGVGGSVDDGGMDLAAGTAAAATTAAAGPTVCSSLLLCPSDHAAVALPTLRSLITCCTTHTDRRCRILALQTLALVGRSVYARTRESEEGIETYAQRDAGVASRVSDEVVNDVAATLLGVGLEEDDDGVSAAAFEAVGMLVLSTSSITPSSAALAGRFDGGFDVLTAEIASMVTSDPTWRGTGDPTWMASGCGRGDSALSLATLSPNATAMHELASRVYSSLIPPRMRRILHRIRQYRPTPPFGATSGVSHVERTLPFVSGALGYMLKTERCTALGMDRAGYAKRWTEMDARGMAGETIDGLILPILTDGSSYGTDGLAAKTAAGAASMGKAASLAALRLVHACPAAEWTEEVCRAVAGTMSDTIRAAAASQKILDAPNFAILLVALRGLQPSERAEALSLSIDAIVKMLPTTEIVPATIGSAGLPLSDGTIRRPVRLGLLIEAALLAIMPNPADGDSDVSDESHNIAIRSNLVGDILSSPVIQSVLSQRSDQKRKKKQKKEKGGSYCFESLIVHDDGSGNYHADRFSATNTADELVLVVCSVANLVGRKLLGHWYDCYAEDGTDEISNSLEAWHRTSLALLYELSSCLSWRDPIPRIIDEGSRSGSRPRNCTTISMAARGAYLQLLSQCLAATDLLDASSSVTANMISSQASGENDNGLTALAEAAPLRDDTFALGLLSDLMDWMAETKLTEGISHRGVRIASLALLSDYWVQVCRLILQSQEGLRGEAPTTLNKTSAQKIISKLSSEISNLIEEQQNSATIDTTAARKKATMHDLFVCIACIENMALAANDWSKRFGSYRNSKSTEDDSAYIVVSMSTAILNEQGRNAEENGSNSDTDTLTDPNSAASIRRGMVEECIYASKRIQASASGNDRAHSNGSTHFGEHQVTASVYCSPLIERERAALGKSKKLPSSYQKKSRNIGSNLSLMLDSGHEFLNSFSVEANNENAAGSQLRSIGDTFDHDYLFQHYRQVILFRTGLAMESAQVIAEPKRQPMRPIDVLRLSIPPLITSSHCHKESSPSLLSLDTPMWTNSSVNVCGTSDPVSMRSHFAVRFCPRYDGEIERRLVFITKLHNITAVSIPKGVRMDLSVESSHHALKGGAKPDLSLGTTSFHRQEIKAGDHIAWTIETQGWPMGGGVLQTNVSFRDMESETTTLQWIRQPATSTKVALSNVAEEDEDNDDDFSTGHESSSAGFLESEAEAEKGDEFCDILLAGEPLTIPPSIVLQPCPLVFFGTAEGDESAFRFFWSRLPHSFGPIKLTSSNAAGMNEIDLTAGCAAQEIARLSQIDLSVTGDDGESTDGWAFASWTSNRLFCVLVRDKTDLKGALYVRGDSDFLIKSVVGSKKDRSMFVSDLTNGRFALLEP